MCTHNPECVRIRVCTRALVCRPMYTDVIYAYCYHLMIVEIGLLLFNLLNVGNEVESAS